MPEHGINRVRLAARFAQSAVNCIACGTVIKSTIDREGFCSYCWRYETEEGRQHERNRLRAQKLRARQSRQGRQGLEVQP